MNPNAHEVRMTQVKMNPNQEVIIEQYATQVKINTKPRATDDFKPTFLLMKEPRIKVNVETIIMAGITMNVSS